MCKIVFGKFEDLSVRHEIATPSTEDVRRLVGMLGDTVEFFHLLCDEGILIVGCTDSNRATVTYRYQPFRERKLPGGRSFGWLVDRDYFESGETIGVFSEGVKSKIRVYHTVEKSVASMVVEFFMENSSFPDNIEWVYTPPCPC